MLCQYNLPADLRARSSGLLPCLAPSLAFQGAGLAAGLTASVSRADSTNDKIRALEERLASLESQLGGAAAAPTNCHYMLGGDIGGTNSRFQLFAVPKGSASLANLKAGQAAPGELVFEKKYENLDYETFPDVVKQFISDSKAEAPVTACLAVAGPVVSPRPQHAARASIMLLAPNTTRILLHSPTTR